MTEGDQFLDMVTLDHSPVASSPQVLGGLLVFQGTRVPAQSLLDYLNDGFSVEQFLEYFPSVKKSDAVEFLRLVKAGGR
jgi:uncharacterized protein (DUF433 family)